MMRQPIRHSHIAVRADLSSLARTAGASVSSGVDELGPYHFFDLQVSGDEADQRIRFATHEGDSMVHLLAERIENANDLASALLHVGIGDASKISISTNKDDAPLRDIKEITNCMTAQELARTRELVVPPGKKRYRTRRAMWNGPLAIRNSKERGAKILIKNSHGTYKLNRKLQLRSTILPQFVGLTFQIFHSDQPIHITVSQEMVGHKFGEFAQSAPLGHFESKKKKG